jgi:hypothetical protein
MRRTIRDARPFWRAPERLIPRPELSLGAAVVLAMLLVEVWQTSRMAQICLSLDQDRSELKQANAQLLYARAAADRRSTRAELVPVAAQLGLAPTRREQVWRLPSEFLADDRTTPRDETPVPLLALAERVSDALVPEATARGRVTR